MNAIDSSKSGSQLRAAIATVLYNPEDSILRTLIDSFELTGLQIFIFVNGDISEAAERCLLALSNGHIIRSAENIGLGGGLNAVSQAALWAGVTHLLLFDQDSAPAPDLVEDLFGCFVELVPLTAGRLAALAPRLIAPDGESYLQPWYSRRRGRLAEDVVPVDFLPTSGTLISLAAYEAIGPFRGDYFVDGIDVEWCFRAWSLGFSCALAQTLTMPHRWGHADGGRTPQILRQSPLRAYYYLRNATHGLRLAHLPLRWKTRTAVRLTAQSVALIAQRRFSRNVRQLIMRAVKDGWSGRLGPAPVEFRTLLIK
jgi:rhamnosyltransferase